MADLLIPDNEQTRAYKERQKDIQKLFINDFHRKYLNEELGICKDLHTQKIITSADHEDWKKTLVDQTSFLDQEGEAIKKRIQASLEANDPRKK